MDNLCSIVGIKIDTLKNEDVRICDVKANGLKLAKNIWPCKMYDRQGYKGFLEVLYSIYDIKGEED